MAKVWEGKLQKVLKYSEKELGTQNPKRLDMLREWTDATAQLHKKLQQMLPKIQRYDAELGNLLESLGRIANVQNRIRTQSSNQVSVTMTTAFATFWLIPRMGRFSSRFPDIDLRLVMTDTFEPPLVVVSPEPTE